MKSEKQETPPCCGWTGEMDEERESSPCCGYVDEKGEAERLRFPDSPRDDSCPKL